MKQDKKFESYCEDVAKNSEEKVEYIRSVLWEKSNGNTNILLGIKAEAEEWDIVSYFSAIMAKLALLIATGSWAYDILSPQYKDIVENIVVCAVVIFAVKMFLEMHNKSFTNMRKWRKYILVVIDELIEKSQDEISTYKIEIEDKSTHEKTVYIEKIKK